MKRGRSAEAGRAFGRVVACGFRTRQLGVKFRFNRGSTVFWSDPKISAPYAMWLRQIAKSGTAAKACLNRVWPTSRTGSEQTRPDQTNDALSNQRAGFSVVPGG